MKHRIIFKAWALTTLLGFGHAIGQTPVITDKVTDKLTPCTEVALTGLLDDRMRINLEKRLLAIDSATLLSGFEHRPGAQVWIGEHVGKFLFTASNVWRYSHDPRLKSLADAMEKTYVATQLPNGYLGTYLPKDYWTEWDVWAHKYAIYGLLGYYQITGDQQALETAEKAADLVCRTFGTGAGQRDINASGWHAGLASGSILGTMVDLYRYTGRPEYLRFARYLLSAWEGPTGPKIMSNLQKWGRVDKIGDAKAYEMLSCFVGILQYYRLTGEKKYLLAMETAWQDIVTNRLYVTGTSSSFEVFQGNHRLPGANKDDIGEGCVTVTWLQFNAQLLALTGKMRYSEEIEKSVYNHLLAAEDPLTGCVSYYTPITGSKPYKCDQGYSCCLSSVPGGISLIPFLCYARSGDQLWVLLYERGSVSDTVLEANGQRLAVRLDCQSNFPLDGRLVYTVHPSRPDAFGINFRVPEWASGFSAAVNGKPIEPAAGGIALTGVSGAISANSGPGISVANSANSRSAASDQTGISIANSANSRSVASDQTGISVATSANSTPAASSTKKATSANSVNSRPAASSIPRTGSSPGGHAVCSIHRQWADGDTIVITMQMPLMRLAGGLSFPGCVAFKRGPQVLAEDSVLTATIGSQAHTPALTDLSALLPKQWSGKQAYGIGSFVLTPFADAGQLDGPIKIWLNDKATAQ